MQNISLNYGGTQIKILSFLKIGLEKNKPRIIFFIELRGVMVMWECE